MEHDEISFEEVLMLRLVFEITEAMKGTRSEEFMEYIESIVPEFDEYRRIILAVINLEEHNLPQSAATAEINIKPYP